uniref:Uncharacterized protein n=1 Tax=Plectus sambesii TaxID=2011161 RepID=A0A914WM79_9BILA
MDLDIEKRRRLQQGKQQSAIEKPAGGDDSPTRGHPKAKEYFRYALKIVSRSLAAAFSWRRFRVTRPVPSPFTPTPYRL